MRDAVVFPLDEGMHMLAFKAMKIVPAHFIIHKAIARGDLKPGGSVIETSSGNFAFGMAMVCNRMNSRFIAISDPAIDDSYRRHRDAGRARGDRHRQEGLPGLPEGPAGPAPRDPGV